LALSGPGTRRTASVDSEEPIKVAVRDTRSGRSGGHGLKGPLECRFYTARWSSGPSGSALALPVEFSPGSCTPNPAPPPRTRVGGEAPPGGRRRASRRLNSVRTPRGWLAPARGEFPAPNSPLGPPPVLHGGFLGHWEGHKSVECIRYDFLRSGCN
jgi:hypothetical protein